MKIRKLRWGTETGFRFLRTAKSPFGTYIAYNDGWAQTPTGDWLTPKHFVTLKGAKLLSQADFENRVWRCIDPREK